jgi:hypothetical protein
MSQPAGWAVLSLVLALGGCSEQKSAEITAAASRPAQEQAAEPAPAPETAAPAQPETVSQTPVQEPAPAAAVTAPASQAKTAAPQPAAATQAPVDVPTPAAAAPVQAIQAAPQPPAPAAPKTAAPPDVILLTGSPLGGVRLEHKLHATRAGNDCTTCHHPSRTEKPASAPQQACSDCHTKKAMAPMKTIYQGAFHNPMAQSGTCIDCHKSENAKGKKAPMNCMDCHKQENQ